MQEKKKKMQVRFLDQENPIEKHWIKIKGKIINNGWKNLECKLVKTEKDLRNSGSLRAFLMENHFFF